MAQQNTLKNIFSRSFPAQHLFEVSLVQDTNPDLPFYKNRFFCFISCAPGMQNQGSRTYDRQRRVTIKCECEKLFALADNMRMHAKGYGQHAGNYSIMADSSRSSYNNGQGMYKSCFVSNYLGKANKQGQQKLMVSVSFKAGNEQPFGLSVEAAEAVGIAQIIEMIAKHGIEQELAYAKVNIGTINQTPNRPAPVQQNNNQQNNFQQNGQYSPPQNNQYGNQQIQQNPVQQQAPQQAPQQNPAPQPPQQNPAPTPVDSPQQVPVQQPQANAPSPVKPEQSFGQPPTPVGEHQIQQSQENIMSSLQDGMNNVNGGSEDAPPFMSNAPF